MRMTGSETGLVGYWSMMEGMGQNVGDFTPNNLDGVLGSSAGADASDPTWVSTTWPHS